MVKVKTAKRLAKKTTPKKTTSKEPRQEGVLRRTRQLLISRSKLVLALGVVGLLGFGFHTLWQHYGPAVIHRERYRLPSERITITTTPEWITCDIRDQVVRNAGLSGRLSILDESFVQTLEDAFSLHPWVESVDRITKGSPPAVHLDMTYRQPVAVVEIAHGTNGLLLPVDKNGIHLPASDVPAIRLNNLPRISGIVGQPPTGQRWDDPRIIGATALADRLSGVWQSYHLANILPSARAEIHSDRRFFVFNLITRGGTRIVWGAVTQKGTLGEADFQTKLERLKQCAERFRLLDPARGPAVVDIRRGLVITPRTAKKPAPDDGTEAVVK